MELVLVFLAGFAAAMVDGSLGMGFGPTSASILLAGGLSPSAVSTTVNLAKVATGVAGGVSHWRYGNIDRRLVIQLAMPGAVGAVIGTTIVTRVDGDQLRPILAALLIAVGLRILFRFSRVLPTSPSHTHDTQHVAHSAGTAVAAATGGVTNGLIGAWGPVVTPYLLHRGILPRFVVGSVNTAEIAVATVASGSLLRNLGDDLRVGTVVAMLAGGVLAAPLAARTVRHLPARGMGIAVAGLLLFTSSRELATWAELGESRWLAYGVVTAMVSTAALAPSRARRPVVAPAT